MKLLPRIMNARHVKRYSHSLELTSPGSPVNFVLRLLSKMATSTSGKSFPTGQYVLPCNPVPSVKSVHQYKMHRVFKLKIDRNCWSGFSNLS